MHCPPLVLTEAFIEVDLTQIMLLLEQPEVVVQSIPGFELSTFRFSDQILVYDPTPYF